MNCSFLGDKWSSGPQWLFLHSKRLVIMYHFFFFTSFQLRFHFHHLHSLCLYCSMYTTYFNLVAFQDSIHPHLCAPPALFTNSYNTQAILWSISLSVFLEPCCQATFHSSKDFYDPLLLTGGNPISSNYKGPPTNSNNPLEYKPPNSPDCFILSPKHMSYTTSSCFFTLFPPLWCFLPHCLSQLYALFKASLDLISSASFLCLTIICS